MSHDVQSLLSRILALEEENQRLRLHHEQCYSIHRLSSPPASEGEYSVSQEHNALDNTRTLQSPEYINRSKLQVQARLPPEIAPIHSHNVNGTPTIGSQQAIYKEKPERWRTFANELLKTVPQQKEWAKKRTEVLSNAQDFEFVITTLLGASNNSQPARQEYSNLSLAERAEQYARATLRSDGQAKLMSCISSFQEVVFVALCSVLEKHSYVTAIEIDDAMRICLGRDLKKKTLGRLRRGGLLVCHLIDELEKTAWGQSATEIFLLYGIPISKCGVLSDHQKYSQGYLLQKLAAPPYVAEPSGDDGDDGDDSDVNDDGDDNNNCDNHNENDSSKGNDDDKTDNTKAEVFSIPALVKVILGDNIKVEDICHALGYSGFISNVEALCESYKKLCDAPEVLLAYDSAQSSKKRKNPSDDMFNPRKRGSAANVGQNNYVEEDMEFSQNLPNQSHTAAGHTSDVGNQTPKSGTGQISDEEAAATILRLQMPEWQGIDIQEWGLTSRPHNNVTNNALQQIQAPRNEALETHVWNGCSAPSNPVNRPIVNGPSTHTSPPFDLSTCADPEIFDLSGSAWSFPASFTDMLPPIAHPSATLFPEQTFVPQFLHSDDEEAVHSRVDFNCAIDTDYATNA